jgi:tRNA pseudouridine38-40 synthase
MVARWEMQGDALCFVVKANRFLRGMVRALVGTMLLEGQGKMTPEDFEAVIVARNRKAAGAAAPPEGLFLVEVRYPDDYFSGKAST